MMSDLMEIVNCNICGSSDSRLYLNLDGYSYRKCRNCGLVYQNPRPDFTHLKNIYNEDYFNYEFKNQYNFFNLMLLGLRDIGFDKIFPTPKGKRFLDIGCATGLLLKHMKESGWCEQGVEICRESAEYGIRNYGVNIFIGTLEEARFPGDFFDVVHFSHLIEHVPDPKGLLSEVFRIVKPNGHVIITTPNVGGLQARISGKGWRSAIPEHIYLFSKSTLRLLLELTGFNIVKQVSWGGIPLGKRPNFIKRPADKLAKFFNVGDVMLFHCVPNKNVLLKTHFEGKNDNRKVYPDNYNNTGSEYSRKIS